MFVLAHLSLNYTDTSQETQT